MKSLLALIALLCLSQTANAHSWYSKKVDPVYGNSCCGGIDCAQWVILPGEISAEENGIRVRLSLERTKTINVLSQFPIDALVTWDRVQTSEDGNLAWSKSAFTNNTGKQLWALASRLAVSCLLPAIPRQVVSRF